MFEPHLKLQVATSAPGSIGCLRWAMRKVEVRRCLCRWIVDRAHINIARSAYVRWRMALDRVRLDLKISGQVRAVVITDDMPPATPWGK